MERCPKCQGFLEDDGSCSCGFKKRTAVARTSDGFTGQNCAFTDQGRECTHRGILSSTTHGAGQWFCREHWAVVNRVQADGVGNYAVSPTKRSLHMRQWDGWVYNGKTRRLEKEIDVSQFDDVAPEDVQA